jgi:hypothetical protein
MVISARSNWFIDPFNPLFCEGIASQNSRPVPFRLPVILSPKGQNGDRKMERQCGAMCRVLSVRLVMSKFFWILRCVNIDIPEEFAFIFRAVV